MQLIRILLVPAVFAASAGAQTPAARDTTIDATMRQQTIEALISRLDAGYVFPEVASRMREDLSRRAAAGEYERLTSARAFAESLTAHLQSVSRDKHLRVTLLPPGSGRPSAEDEERMRERMRADNYGIGQPERLDGNVGYLEVRTFGVSPNVMGEALAAAMSELADTDALIIDVRRNGGGSPAAVAFLSTYLFGADTVHLNSLYFRPADRTDHFWTRASVPGRRFGPEKPVYVLTSRRTFSAAEEFTYNLQSRRRATIVGDTTGGGAHPGSRQRLNDVLAVFVPSGRAINPVTGTNWEGTGIIPDVPVASDAAKEIAHREALKRLGRVR